MPRVEVRGEPSFLSNVSDNGVQLFVHVSVQRSGAIEAVFLTAVHGEDVKELTRRETSRKKLREELDKLSAETGLRTAHAPGDYVAWRVREAVRAHLAAGRTLTPAQEKAHGRVPVVTEPPPHPASVLSTEPGAEQRVVESFALHTEPEFRRWLPPPKAMEHMVEAIKEKQALVQAAPSLVAGEGAAPADPSDESPLFARAIDRFYGPEERAALALALRDAALVMESTRRHARALEAVSVADAVEASGLLTSPPHQIPFVFGLYYKLAVLQQQLAKPAT